MTRPPRIGRSGRKPASATGHDPTGDPASLAMAPDAPPDALEEEAEDTAPLLVENEPEGETSAAFLARGVEAIRAQERHAPTGPGVYRMIGEDGEVLYVGKARSIRKRVASYARGQGHSNRIARMISLTTSMVFITTSTETEALLLEANLIKQLRPRFNVLLRDDKSFPYILLTGDHAAPQIAKHRGARNRKGDYFGPFASVWAVNRTIKALQRAFLLRSCPDSYFENRTRPCLLWQIKRCAGPCTNEIAPERYMELVREARDFLSGKSRKVRESLASEMNAAAEALEFEKAARLRDRIAALSAIQGAQDINPRTVEEADVFAIVDQAGQFAVEVFFFRNFQNWGNRTYFPRADRSMSLGDVLDAFLGQFYADKPSARLVLVSHETENRELLAQALSARAGRKVEVAAPKRGERKELVDHAARNARETLGRKLADTAAQERLLDALGKAFGIDRQIRRVEVYDNSHISGANAVGAMIVAGPGGFLKAQYRTFNIASDKLTPGDDYAMMREVLTRRFSRLLREERKLAAPASAPGGDQYPLRAAPAANVGANDAADLASERPDLILIDGGAGQFQAARQTLAGLGVEGVAIAAIAKGPDRNAGRETFFLEGRDSFKLEPRDPALYFVQRLRDEAHRFAIGAHRAKRKRDFVKNPLDEIVGIGPVRKRALLQAFGTAKAISRAALSDLEKVPGVNAATARLVYDHFNERS